MNQTKLLLLLTVKKIMKHFRLSFVMVFLFTVVVCCKKNSYSPINISPNPDSLLSWHQIASANGQKILDIWFTSLSTGYCSTSDSNIYQSLDSGKTWSKVPTTSSSVVQNFFFLNSQYGFAQGASKIDITRDGGNTWTTKSLPTGNALGVFFISPSTGYYCDLSYGVYKTTDTCNTWTLVYHSSSGNLGYYPYFLNSNTGFVASSDGILSKTSNGSASWQQIASNVASNATSQQSYNTLLFLDSLNGFYGTKAGLLKTTDGGTTWNVVNANGGNVNIVKFLDANTGYYLSDAAIYKTTNAGQSWTTSCKLGSDSFFGMSFINSSTGWACTNGGYIYRITN